MAGSALSAGDAASIEGPERVGVSAEAAAELILVDVPLEFRPVGAWARCPAACSDRLGGKVVVDITNPIDSEAFEPFTIEAPSAAQETGAAIPGARVAKAFETTFAGSLVDGKVGGQPLEVSIASDEGGVKDTVGRFVRDAGLKPVGSGPLARAGQLEALGLLHMVVQGSLGTNLASAVKFLP